MINIINDIKLLDESFEFQSRNIKGRKEEKLKQLNLKFKEVFKKFGTEDYTSFTNLIKSKIEEIGFLFEGIVKNKSNIRFGFSDKSENRQFTVCFYYDNDIHYIGPNNSSLFTLKNIDEFINFLKTIYRKYK